MDAIKLLRRSIKASGLSNRKFAEDILSRDERTIRRWLSGETSIPLQVQKFLSARHVEKPAPK